MLSTKSVSQQNAASAALLETLDRCRTITYSCMKFGEENKISDRRGMKAFYRTLGKDLPSFFRADAIARGCAVLRSRLKSERREKGAKHGKPLKLAVYITSGFFVTAKGKLFINLGKERYEQVQLNKYMVSKLQGAKMKSLAITPFSVSIFYSKEVEDRPTETVYGFDRNEKNLTFGNRDGTVKIDLSAIPRIKQTTREIVASFRRPDVRIRKSISSKYWKRSDDRTGQILHEVLNFAVKSAMENGAAFAVEDLKGISAMYRKGNGKGKDYRFRMNGWQHGETLEMLGYKCAAEGVAVIQLSKQETRGTTRMHFRCGERLRDPERGDGRHARMLWCETCKEWVDRDENAAINQADRGLSRLKGLWLASSLPGTRVESNNPHAPREKGPAHEAMMGSSGGGGAPGADAGKFG